jgi:hypothetical protein
MHFNDHWKAGNLSRGRFRDKALAIVRAAEMLQS